VVVISPLFAPDNIAKYLGLRWTDGTTNLLTWLGPDITPLSPDWLATYCRIVTRIRPGRGALLRGAAIRKGFADLHSRPHPWGSLDLPYESVPDLAAPHFAHHPLSRLSARTCGQSCTRFAPKPPAEMGPRRKRHDLSSEGM